MMNEPVVISSEKLNIQPVTLTDENLNEVAKQIVTNTAIKLQNVENRIKKAEKLTSQAEDIDTNVGFFGRLTGKAQKLNHQKFDLIIDVNTQHSELFREFADIQQEAIKLVTIQYQLSNGLITYFSSALKGQLKDANGKIIELSENGTEIINHIIQQAQQYAIEQLENKQTRSVVQQTIIQVQQINGEIAYLNTQIRKYQKQNELMLKLQKKANIAIAVAIIAILLTIAVLAWSFLK